PRGGATAPRAEAADAAAGHGSLIVALVRPFGGHAPQLGRDVYLADTAVVIGDVVIGDESSLWFSAIARGDVGSIRIGKRSNIQDLTMIHVTGGKADTTIGDEVTVGHRV